MNFLRVTKREASDWLSPILVKELRQGMRGRLFLSSFLVLQAAMILCTSGALLAASTPQASESFGFFSGLFWFIIGIALVGVIPLAGMGAVRNEVLARSMELIFLTRLTPWRIVAGKWTALTAQAFLFVCAVLPYIVLRYFLGGIDLVGELKILTWLLLISLLLTGLTVAGSAYSAWLVRSAMILFFIIFLFGGYYLVSFFLMGMGGMFVSSGAGAPSMMSPFVIAAVLVPLSLLFLFETGAAKIAPPANRHNLRLRLLGLAFLLGGAGLDFAGAPEGVILLGFLPILVACIASLVQAPVLIRSIYVPFVRKGVLGRLAGHLFLYPGWPSAVIYTTVVFALFSGAVASSTGYARNSTDLQEFFYGIILLYGALVFPVAITRIFASNTDRGFSWFVGAQAFMMLFSSIVIAIHEVTNNSYAAFVSFLPTTSLILYMSDSFGSDQESLMVTVSAIATVVSLIALTAVAARRVIPHVSRIERSVPG